MALDEVRPQTLHASSRSRHCCSLGASLVATCQRLGRRSESVAFLDKEAPVDLAKAESDARRKRCCDHPHVLPLGGEMGQGTVVERGRDEEVCERALDDLAASASSTRPLRATIPPKAETGSPSRARL